LSIYEKDFLEKMGKKGLEEFRDELLDEILKLRKIIRNV
jgi:hypothetical protein